jgi:hypothetical protein
LNTQAKTNAPTNGCRVLVIAYKRIAIARGKQNHKLNGAKAQESIRPEITARKKLTIPALQSSDRYWRPSRAAFEVNKYWINQIVSEEDLD